MEIWVDPACSKCRAASAALDGTTVVGRDAGSLAKVLPGADA